MSEIKVGDRVRVIGHNNFDFPCSKHIGEVGTLSSVESDPLGMGLDYDVLLDGQKAPLSFCANELEPA